MQSDSPAARDAAPQAANAAPMKRDFDPGIPLTLDAIARTAWRFRYVILLSMLVAVGVAALYVFTIGERHKSEGFVQTATVQLAEYKKYATVLSDRARFLEWLKRRADLPPPELAEFAEELDRRDLLSSWITPLFAVTKSDVRELAEAPKDPKDAGGFVGVRVAVERKTADLAQRLALACGDYVRDFIVASRVAELSLHRTGEVQRDLAKVEKSLLTASLDLTLLEAKREELARVRARYPDQTITTGRQIVSLDNKGARYLPPVIQLVGIESQIADTKESVTRDKRQRDKLALQLDFYSKIRSQPLAKLSALEIVDRLRDARAELLRGRDATEGAMMDALAEVDAERSAIQLTAEEGVRFFSGPAIDNPWERRRRQIILLAAALTGLLAGLLIALFLGHGRAGGR